MSIAFWFDDPEKPLYGTYVGDAVLEVCQALEEKGILPRAGGRLEFMDGQTGGGVIPILERAIAHIPSLESSHAAKARTALKCLSELRDRAVKHPLMKIIAWR